MVATLTILAGLAALILLFPVLLVLLFDLLVATWRQFFGKE